jgi:hypothetical protein
MKLSIQEYIAHIGNNPKTGKPYTKQNIGALIKRGKLQAKKEHGILIITI